MHLQLSNQFVQRLLLYIFGIDAKLWGTNFVSGLKFIRYLSGRGGKKNNNVDVQFLACLNKNRKSDLMSEIFETKYLF